MTTLTHQPPPLSEPRIVPVATGRSNLNLDPTIDHVLQMPAEPLGSELVVRGGRNVVLVGGEITTVGRGLYLNAQTGTAYVEGLKISGQGTTDAMNLDQRLGATVILQNIFVENCIGSVSGWHADVLQTWAGPRRLLVDRLRGTSQYQGLFLLPRQRWSSGPWPELVDLRRIELDVQTGYALWTSGGVFPVQAQDVWVRAPRRGKEMLLWPKPSTGDATWSGVTVGTPTAPFVDPAAVGVGYRSVWS